jgi:chorismate lyase / 3-hydroxybenzoate synthase
VIRRVGSVIYGVLEVFGRSPPISDESMTVLDQFIPLSPRPDWHAAPACPVHPPAWAQALVRGVAAEAVPSAPSGLTARVFASPSFSLVEVRVPAASSMDDGAFECGTHDAYALVARALEGRAARHPVRFWNYLPGIHRPAAGGRLDRYMVFNAGRFAACSEWLGGPQRFGRLLATASAVGWDGPDLVVHALASREPGRPVENPRQVPAYRYSHRFGPRPPCFARATVLAGGPGAAPTVLIGGTASIRGEESMFPGDVAAQAGETFENLRALVRAAGPSYDLSSFAALRVYYAGEVDVPTIAALVAPAFARAAHVEYVRADLCRPELLVEIEGVIGGVTT